MHFEPFWHYPVIYYFFLAGLGAGAVTISASVLLREGGFGDSSFSIARLGAFIGPFPLMLGTFLIIFELGQPLRALNLFHLINISPMSIGSWVLLIFIPITILYAATFLPPKANHHDGLAKIRDALAWICIPTGIGVAIYTAVMLGAMPARPFWNSPILAALFVCSAMSGGVASIILLGVFFRRKSKDPIVRQDYHNSTYLLVTSDALLIAAELGVIFLFLLFGHLTIGDTKLAMQTILPGGELASTFWIWVVLVGLVLPGIVEVYQILPRMLHGKHFHGRVSLEILAPLCILIGGFALRYVIVMAGQLTAPSVL